MSFPTSLRSKLVEWYRLNRCARRVGDREWAHRLMAVGQPMLSARVQPDGRLLLTDVGLPVTADHTFVVRGYDHVRELQACGFTFSPREGGILEVRGQGITLHLNGTEELFIAREVFCDRTYDVAPADAALVIDVGMNIGTTSLFLASLLPDARVVAFEPFRKTFARAEQQFALNPELAARIDRHPFGLWTGDEVRELPYDSEEKGGMGLWAAPSTATREQSERVELRDAATVLAPLLRNRRDGRVILKLDCEGSEYGILGRLLEAGLIGEFDAILIEWHRITLEHDPRQLRTLLGNAGYQTLCHGYVHRSYGMMYAFNTSRAPRPTREHA